MKTVKTYNRKVRRKRRISNQYFGTKVAPRIAIFRSNRYIYAQAINDEERLTLLTLSGDKKKEAAKQVGLKLAELLKKKNISKAVFDRGSYAYHGCVAAVADGLREGKIEV